MRKPAYRPNLTLNDFIRARKYDGINAEVFSFLRDVVDAVFVPVSADKKEAFILFLAEIYNVGRQNGIREERWSRRLKKNHTEQVQPIAEPKARAELMQEITRRLESADHRQLRLVWVYASHLIG